MKQAFKTLLDCFQASSAEKCKPSKGLKSSTPGQSTNDQSYATSSSEIGNRFISAMTKNRRTTVPYQNDSSDQELKKMKFNPQWLEK